MTQSPSLNAGLQQAMQQINLGRLAAAEQLLQRILKAAPKHPDALHLLGLVYGRGGDPAKAIALIKRAIKNNPGAGVYYHNLGLMQVARGKTQDAERALRKAISLLAANSQVYNDLGLLYSRQGRAELALSAFAKAVKANADNVPALTNLANEWLQSGDVDQAVVNFNRALALNGEFYPACNGLGSACLLQGQAQQAVDLFERAIALKPQAVEAHNNLGNALKAAGRHDEAIVAYRRVLELSPQHRDALVNLGYVLRKSGDVEGAIAIWRGALETYPDCKEAHYNLGNALSDLCQWPQAVRCYRRALEIDPDYVGARWNYSMLMLLMGDFEQGWKEYEWRWRRHAMAAERRDFDQPLWDGSALQGRTILLHAEQGNGDSIQFVRYVAEVARFGGRIIVECPASLVSLFSTMAGIDQLVAKGDALPAFDLHAPLMSLPYILHTTLQSIPAKVPYLFAAAGDLPLPAAVTESLSPAGGGLLKVGIVWAGSPSHKNDGNRSASLSAFSPLASVPGVQLFSLQVGERRSELQEQGSTLNIIDATDQIGDYADTAAIIDRLDLVISVDTSVAHLAAAMAKPVWMLLPFRPEWRWLLERSDSPWYPTLRLYRQPAAGDWRGVMIEVAEALAELAAGRKALPVDPS